MKKVLLFFVFVCISIFSKTQGNLQFNQVLTFESGDNYLVPTGKVLKIESINITSTNICIPRSSTVSGTCTMGSGASSPVIGGIYNGINYLTIGNFNFNTPSFSGSGGWTCGGWQNPECWSYDFTSLNFKTPIWLESGKKVSIHSSFISILISAIEFNIIP